MQRVLMGHKRDVPFTIIGPSGDRCDETISELLERLRGEWKVIGLSEVCLQLTGKHGGELLPCGAPPAHGEKPFGEAGVGEHIRPGSRRDQRGGLDGTIER